MDKKRPVISFMYDFDKTLCTKDMQEYSFIPRLGLSAQAFWEKANSLARDQQMDGILAYMKVMLDESRTQKQPIRRQDFVAAGGNIEFFPGVGQWFSVVNNRGAELGLDIRHFIISSGLKEIIEGSAIAHEFSHIYASEYLYDENDVAVWPKVAVNYTTKTQFLFRINKGIEGMGNDNELNRYTPEDERPVPFRNMVYIGDGITDVPCMKLVKVNGGTSIAVHARDMERVSRELMKQERINFYAEADYRPESGLFFLVSRLLEKLAAQNDLEATYLLQRKY